MVEGNTIGRYLNLQTKKSMLFHAYKILRNFDQICKICNMFSLPNLTPLRNIIVTFLILIICKSYKILFSLVKFDSKLKILNQDKSLFFLEDILVFLLFIQIVG